MDFHGRLAQAQTVKPGVQPSSRTAPRVATKPVNLNPAPYLSGPLRFLKASPLNKGAPPGWWMNFGKQNQFVTMGNLIIHTEGDGSHRTPPLPVLRGGSVYNSVNAWDFSAKGDGRFEQLIDQHGRSRTGISPSAPCFHEGGTVAADPDHHEVITIPGFMRGWSADVDPHGIMKANFGKVHIVNIKTRQWRAQSHPGTNWVGEHWGGAFHGERRRVYLQGGPSGGNFGSMRWYDPDNDKWSGDIRLTARNVERLPVAPGIGRLLLTDTWRQRVWHRRDELIVWCGYRGMVIGIDLETYDCRPIAYLGRYRDVIWPSGDVEGIRTVETGLCIDEARGLAYVCASHDVYFAEENEAFDIAQVNLATGEVKRSAYPGEDLSFTSCEWVADKLVCGDCTGAFAAHWLVYELAAARPAAAAVPIVARGPALCARPDWAASTKKGEVRAAPNSALATPQNMWVINESRKNAGLPAITRFGGEMWNGRNKYGEFALRFERVHWPTGSGVSPYGSAPDPRNARVFVPCGDVLHFSHTGWTMFDLTTVAWTAEVIKTSSYLEIKVDNVAKPDRKDDPRPARNFDGSLRCQHGYGTRAYLPGLDWLGAISSQQFGPSDMGGSPECVFGDLRTGRWMLDNPIPERPGWSNDVQDFVRVDHHSGNPYSWSSAWQALHTIDLQGPQPWAWREVGRWVKRGIARPSGSIDHENGEILLVEDATVEGKAFTVNLASGARTDVRITGAKAGEFKPQWYGGMTYCPHLHAHLFFNIRTYDIYQIKRVGAAEFTCDIFPVNGLRLLQPKVQVKGGGMLNDFFTVSALGGVVIRVDDFSPFLFIGTA